MWTGAGGCGRALRAWPVLCLLLAGCSGSTPPPAPPETQAAPTDAQHAGITEPHGDHTPHHGGIVLMNGDVHYEVVMDASGRYEVWFSDAVRTELPASVASNARVAIERPGETPEPLALSIDDAGESWVGRGRAVAGDGVIVKLTYSLRGEPHEVEIPFVAATR